jgi:hypothetical protein
MRPTRRDEEMGKYLTLTEPELAASAYRVWKSVQGLPALPEREAPETQEGWLRLGRHAEALLEGAVEKPYSLAGFACMVLVLSKVSRQDAPGVWSKLPGQQRLAWEAVARHLAMVLKCDELESLEEAEAVWPEWAAKRSARG